MKGFIISSILIVVFVGVITFTSYKHDVNANGRVVVDINPSIEFITNQEDVIIKVNALNDDGEVLIAHQDFIGMDVEKAVEDVINLAIELDYLDLDSALNNPNAVKITTLHSNTKIATKLRIKIYHRLDQYLLNLGVWDNILSHEDMEDLAIEADELSIGSGKLRLIKSIQTVNPSFDTDEGARMSVKGLLDIIREVNPLAHKLATLETRKTEIVTLLKTEENPDIIADLQDELTAIEQQITDIQLIKETIKSDFIARREIISERLNTWKERKQALRE